MTDENMSYMHVGLRIQQLLEIRDAGRRGSKSALARYLGVTSGAVSQWWTPGLTDVRISRENLRRVAQFFGMSLDDLTADDWESVLMKYRARHGESLPRGSGGVHKSDTTAPPASVMAATKQIKLVSLAVIRGMGLESAVAFATDTVQAPQALSHRAFAITMPDNALAGHVSQGDLLFVEPTERPRDSDIVLCKLADGSVMVRIYRPLAAGFDVEAVSPVPQTWNSFRHGVEIMAVVMGHYRQLRRT